MELKLNHAISLTGYMPMQNPSFAIEPSTLDFALSGEVAPLEFTTTAFNVGFTEDGKIILARNQRRGIEIAGGHVETGEDLYQAASRENFEETGSKVIGELIPVGFERIISSGVKPENYRYPFPVSFQQFFTSIVDPQPGYVENDECSLPVIVDVEVALSMEEISERKKFIIRSAYLIISKNKNWTI